MNETTIESLEQETLLLRSRLAQAQEAASENIPACIRSAMALCEACRGLPELSINRCPMCRQLQTAL
jgi:hypothetical protein